MKWKVLSASVRGSAHQRSGLPNQDAVDHAASSLEDASPTVLAVSDGHGGARYFRSQVGSTLAVHTAVTLAKDFLASGPETAQVSQLASQIVQVWLAAVYSDLQNNAFTEEELARLEEIDGPGSRQSVIERPELAYGATLLLASASKDRMVYIQLGDGDILAVGADGVTSRPIVADERLVANQTTSLCQPEAWREFRMTVTETPEQMPLLVLLSSDGYINSFRSEEDFMQIGQDYLSILRKQGPDSLAEDLPRILKEATQQGSGDDITLGILQNDTLMRAAPVVAAVKKELAPSTKSVIIRDLKTQQSTQQQKISELASHYEGARKNIRLLWLLVVVVLLVAVGLATQSMWMPLLGGRSGTSSPGARHAAAAAQGGAQGIPPRIAPVPVGGDAPVAAPTPMPSGQWVLTLNDGPAMLLETGKLLTAAELTIGPSEEPYARIKRQDNVIKLTNVSGDLWVVTKAGVAGKSQYRSGDSLPLEENMTITFHKSVSGIVTYRRR